MQKPFARSYWVVEDKFLAGYFPGSLDLEIAEQNITKLLDAGIRCFINLMRDIEIDYDGDRFESYEPVLKRIAQSQGIKVQYFNFPIIDIYIPSKEQMSEILKAINTAIFEKHQPVYVHCRGGIGRTGIVVGCWLIEQKLADKANFMEYIHNLRKGDSARDRESPEIAEQIRFVKSWKVATR